MSIASVPIRPLVLGVMYEDIIAMSKNGGHRGYLLPGKWQLKNVGTGDATFSVSYVFRQTRVWTSITCPFALNVLVPGYCPMSIAISSNSWEKSNFFVLVIFRICCWFYHHCPWLHLHSCARALLRWMLCTWFAQNMQAIYNWGYLWIFDVNLVTPDPLWWLGCPKEWRRKKAPAGECWS